MSDRKRCRWCKAVKPLTDFHRRRDAYDGRYAHCKACHRVRYSPPLLSEAENSARRIVGQQKLWQRPEEHEKARAAARARWQRPEVRARTIAGIARSWREGRG